MKNIIKDLAILTIWILLVIGVSRAFADTCSTNSSTGDQDCQTSWGNYVLPSNATLNAEEATQAALTASINSPVNKFSTDIFVQQLAQTSLTADISLLPYYAALKDLTYYRNFQGLANLIGRLLQAGVLNQSEVDTIDNTLENQQINLDSYNSEVNVAY